jgi:hypothetical protein
MRPNLYRYALILSALMIPLATAAAQKPQLRNSDVYFGYSRTINDTFYQGTGGLNGWNGALHIHLAPFFGGEAEVAQYGVGANSNIPRTTNVMFGPRVTVKAMRIAVFAHGLVGVEHTANSSSNGPEGGVSETGFSYALGGGVDLPLLPFFAWRFSGDRISSTDSPAEGTKARFSTGLVFRF